jgi:N-formylglutamate amidohydrolase
MDEHTLPIIVSIPHAGCRVPHEVHADVALEENDLQHYADIATDRIYGIDGVHVVTHDIARVIVDVNRAPDDIAHEHELAAEGVSVLTTWDGRSVYRREPTSVQVEDLIRRYHEPYHDAIDGLMPKARFLFDGHSYLPVGPKLKGDAGVPRPDVCIGNMNFSTCTREHTVFVREFFANHGYTVAVNFPYAGKYILGHHCHRRRIPGFLVPGMQLELNQRLYVDAATHQPIPDRVEECRLLFSRLVGVFAEAFCGVERGKVGQKG